jgi:3-deoxy-7-phosphoheptulonate synthase
MKHPRPSVPQQWQPASWRACPAAQQPAYPRAKALQRVRALMHGYPPLVVPGEIERLRAHVADAGAGHTFILQGGNCAEQFSDCTAATIMNQLKILLQMSVILTHGARKPVVRIGRIAGQYAKPRSSSFELVRGVQLPSYRGDSVNGSAPTRAARTPDPARLRLAYHYAAMTLNYIHSLIDGGFADLHYPYTWNLHSIEQTPEWPEYKKTVEEILNAIRFMESFGGVRPETLGRIDFYTSHEGLVLEYEEALTHYDAGRGRWYNHGAHMLWIGNRTRALDGAHVEYFRGIANPIGVKLDAQVEADEVLALLERLNPANEAGRVMLITRCGAAAAAAAIPPLVRAVRKARRQVTWCCDPMHGNTVTLPDGRKTRNFTAVLDELRTTYAAHARVRSHLAGVHFELTGDDVTECVGGAVAVTRDDLRLRYHSACDPRLNYAQSLEMAFLIARLLKEAG